LQEHEQNYDKNNSRANSTEGTWPTRVKEEGMANVLQRGEKFRPMGLYDDEDNIKKNVNAESYTRYSKSLLREPMKI
jgi:hypothetical protein